LRRDVSLGDAARLPLIPYCTLKDRVDITDTQNALRKGVKTKFAGHPAVSGVEEEQDFAARLKALTGRTFLGGSAERHFCLLMGNL
jgi:hypothetical protein